jgi:hypothetical protein
MSDTAAHLIDRVLPIAPYRQWVLAYPRPLRLAFARDARATTESARIFLREVFRWQRRQAKLAETKKPRVGAVSFTQRFGSRLDANIHHHALLPDGVFTVNEGGTVGFAELSRPRCEDLEKILERVVLKTLAMAKRRGLLEDEPADALSRMQAESMQPTLPLRIVEEDRPEKLSAFIDGFSLEAGAHVHENDRQGLEHLLRYMLRPPLSLKRLHRMDDGRILIELKRPLYDGTRSIALTPMKFMRRLASIVPPPRVHGTRYFGVLAPASKIRPKIISPGQERAKSCVDEIPAGIIDEGGAEDAMLAQQVREAMVDASEDLLPPPMPERPRRLPWSELLARVFREDVITCDKCGGHRKVTAFVPGGTQARKILDQLGIQERAPPIAKARAPPHQEEAFDLPPDDPGVDEQHADSA